MKKDFIDSYSKMTINKYLQIQEELDNMEDMEETDKVFYLVSLLTDTDPEELENLKLSQFSKLTSVLEFLKEPPKKKMVADKYKIGDYTLEPQFSIQDMTVAQFVDYQTYVKDTTNNLVELLAVLLIPQDHTYNDGYDIEEVKKLIGDNLNIEDALALSAFFFTSYKALSQTMLSCLEKRMKKLKRKKMLSKEQEEEIMKQMEVLRENGVG